MSVAQALAIAAAALVMAGDPWGAKLAHAEAALVELTMRAEAVTEEAITRVASRFGATPDGECMKRDFALL